MKAFSQAQAFVRRNVSTQKGSLSLKSMKHAEAISFVRACGQLKASLLFILNTLKGSSQENRNPARRKYDAWFVGWAVENWSVGRKMLVMSIFPGTQVFFLWMTSNRAWRVIWYSECIQKFQDKMNTTTQDFCCSNAIWNSLRAEITNTAGRHMTSNVFWS